MTKLRALVLEDEWLARNFLTTLLERSGQVTVVAAAADTEQASAVLSGSAFDVAFVDIRLAGEPSPRAGLDWLRQAREATAELDTRFVLTTASREHALEAFDLGVVDYLLKPFTAERISRTIERVAAARAAVPRAWTNEAPERVAARKGRSLVFVPVEEVLAFEAAEGLSFVYAAGARYEIDLSLTAISTSLGDRFARVHRNWLANLSEVRSLDRDVGDTRIVVGQSGLIVPVARDRVTEVRNALMTRSVGLRRVP